MLRSVMTAGLDMAREQQSKEPLQEGKEEAEQAGAAVVEPQLRAAAASPAEQQEDAVVIPASSPSPLPAQHQSSQPSAMPPFPYSVYPYYAVAGYHPHYAAYAAAPYASAPFSPAAFYADQSAPLYQQQQQQQHQQQSVSQASAAAQSGSVGVSAAAGAGASRTRSRRSRRKATQATAASRGGGTAGGADDDDSESSDDSDDEEEDDDNTAASSSRRPSQPQLQTTAGQQPPLAAAAVAFPSYYQPAMPPYQPYFTAVYPPPSFAPQAQHGEAVNSGLYAQLPFAFQPFSPSLPAALFPFPQQPHRRGEEGKAVDGAPGAWTEAAGDSGDGGDEGLRHASRSSPAAAHDVLYSIPTSSASASYSQPLVYAAYHPHYYQYAAEQGGAATGGQRLRSQGAAQSQPALLQQPSPLRVHSVAAGSELSSHGAVLSPQSAASPSVSTSCLSPSVNAEPSPLSAASDDGEDAELQSGLSAAEAAHPGSLPTYSATLSHLHLPHTKPARSVDDFSVHLHTQPFGFSTALQPQSEQPTALAPDLPADGQAFYYHHTRTASEDLTSYGAGVAGATVAGAAATGHAAHSTPPQAGGGGRPLPEYINYQGAKGRIFRVRDITSSYADDSALDRGRSRSSSDTAAAHVAYAAASAQSYLIDGGGHALPPSVPLAAPSLSAVLQRGPALSASKKAKKQKRDEIRFADIRFGEKIGEGSFGEVFRGTLWGVDCAIKASSGSAQSSSAAQRLSCRLPALTRPSCCPRCAETGAQDQHGHHQQRGQQALPRCC